MFAIGWVVALLGALACLAGYFLPWINLILLKINGWQATFGIETNFGRLDSGNFLAVLVLLAPFAVAFLFYRYFMSGGVLNRVTDVYVLAGLAAVVLVLLLITSSDVGSYGTSLEIGWYLCLLGALAWAAGGVLNFLQSQRTV